MAAGRFPGYTAHLPDIRAARAYAREKAWSAPCPGGWLHIDLDATICIDHSDAKENAAAAWKHSPHALIGALVVDCDHPDAAMRAFQKPSDHPQPNWVARRDVQV